MTQLLTGIDAFKFANEQRVELGHKPASYSSWLGWQKTGQIKCGKALPGNGKNGKRYYYPKDQLRQWVIDRWQI